jgi:biotin carboxyl carrier protein
MKKYNITVNGTTYEVIVEEVGGQSVSPAVPVYSAPTTAAAPTAPKAVKTMAGGANKVSAPMPGTILDVKVSLGQVVKKGDVVCVLEAMKMENDIPAPCDGVVASINVQKGSTVAANDILISIN